MSKNIALGNFGETVATNYLKSNKYKIIENNYKTKLGEIDIIAVETKKSRKKTPEYITMSDIIKNEDILVFIEVKLRNNDLFGLPSDAVDKIRQRRYINTASYYTKNYKYANYQIRFDIIEILPSGEINHIKNAY